MRRTSLQLQQATREASRRTTGGLTSCACTKTLLHRGEASKGLEVDGEGGEVEGGLAEAHEEEEQLEMKDERIYRCGRGSRRPILSPIPS